ncbi:putative membrane protein [Streptomyces albus]|uniref:Putative membrane protein n=1 Tax=Streptomyces albus (strain ATCC 21838 / DSM 41398 / FERM P-419 / JCM 4703 / NBRC 107858) TaxID=1081613 RepID=A0A0B5ESX7_STRA4|nr:putative membrane protein [Streptomyces albus]AOU80206.1 putative membrane protein [Streptomyces albus]AYN35921.1 N-acetylmuramoyl-L-alanine amidase [Streptomyces albus]
MSYVTPDSDPRPPRRNRRALTVTAAALVPAALIGWLVWQATADSGDGKPQGGPAPSVSASSPSAGPSSSPDPSASATGPGGKGEDSGKDKDKGRGDGEEDDKGRPGKGSSGPLKGKTVVIDPGHNTGNSSHSAEINRQVNIGAVSKECDTTGTATNGGYPEAKFTLDVAHRLRTLLEEQGATVRLTHDGDRPWGPCVDERARIGNTAGADAAVSIHADGSAPGNRGFHVILPASVHAGAADTRKITAPSRELGERIAGNFLRVTRSAPSNYIGGGTGLDTRSDLGGLNLSTVPKVFIECGNMRDAKDAALVTSSDWRQKAAQGISEGIQSFLRR